MFCSMVKRTGTTSPPLAERLKWLGETALVPLFAKGAPDGADATLLEVRYALETLAQRTLGCSRDRVTTVLKRHGDLADAAAKLLLGGRSAVATAAMSRELLASVDAVTDEAEQEVLAEVVRHATTCLQTNVGRADRQALLLVLDPSTLSDGAEPPARVVFVAGRRFDAFHVSMRPVARRRSSACHPKTPEALAHAAARHYDECRDLAQAQQLKNKDIPEGGAKAVVLVDATGHGDDAWRGRGQGAFREYLNRKAVAAFADALLDVSLEGGAPLPYLGPDEQVVPQDITRIVANAARAGTSAAGGADVVEARRGHQSQGVRRDERRGGGLRRALRCARSGSTRGRTRSACASSAVLMEMWPAISSRSCNATGRRHGSSAWRTAAPALRTPKV